MTKRKTENGKIATTAQIERAVNACARTGMHVGSVELSQDGAIRIVAFECTPSEPANDFDQYKDQL